MKLIVLLSLITSSVWANKRIFSLGAGIWSVNDSETEISDEKILRDFSEGRFFRLSHEGLVSKNFLYVIGVGMNLAKAKSRYQYADEAAETNISALDADISMVEAKLGFKYIVKPWLYIGAGALVGDFQISYDRDDYLEETSGAGRENYRKSENQNYFGYFGDLGIMLASKHWGFRFGAEFNSTQLQKNLETLGDKQPNLTSKKLYIEILWKK